MRFLVDESSGMALVHFLRSKGYNTLAVSEIMPKANDIAVLKRALREKRILITNDKDFGELIFRSGKKHCGVILLRLKDERPTIRIKIVTVILTQYTDRLKNHFTVASENEIRIRSFS